MGYSLGLSPGPHDPSTQRLPRRVTSLAAISHSAKPSVQQLIERSWTRLTALSGEALAIEYAREGVKTGTCWHPVPDWSYWLHHASWTLDRSSGDKRLTSRTLSANGSRSPLQKARNLGASSNRLGRIERS